MISTTNAQMQKELKDYAMAKALNTPMSQKAPAPLSDFCEEEIKRETIHITEDGFGDAIFL